MNLHTSTERDVLHVRFDCADRPGNTISPDVLDELEAVVADVEQGRQKLAAIIFTSAKPNTFITGADLFAMRDMSEAEAARFIERGQSLFQRISELPVTTVAAINGQCLGGGLELALACTHRVAADDGSITLGLPEVKLGILPGWGGCTRLPRVAGLTRVLPLLLTGRMLAPRKALSAGVIDEVVPPEALDAAAHRLARQRRRRRKLPWIDTAAARLAPLRQAILKKARTQTLATTYGNYPGPEAILDVVETGLRDGVKAGLEAEREALARLIRTDACRNLLRLFFLRQASKKALQRELDADALPVHRAAVIGGGTMGSGIVHALIRAGVDVRLIEIDAKQMAAGLRRIKQLLDDDLRAKRLSPTQARRAMHRVSPSLTFTGLRRVDFVIEAVSERPNVKRDVFRQLDSLLPSHAVLASNTSSLSLADLAEATSRPGRVIGMHFFNPVAKMPLLEVVRTGRSDGDALATGIELGQRMGKTPVLVRDGPGFLVNRVLIPYLAEAIKMAAEGQPIDHIDRTMKQWGMPMGPFELLDQVGLDVAVDIFHSVGPRLGDHLPQVRDFDRVIDRNWLGKKTGRGFYRYDAGRGWERWWKRPAEPPVNTELLTLLGAPRPTPQKAASPEAAPPEAAPPESAPDEKPAIDDETAWRLVLPMINEAARVLEEGVVDSTDTIDLATVLGLGWAPFRGGLARFADTQGLRTVVTWMDACVGQHGQRFRATPALRRAAEADEPMQAIADQRPTSRDGQPHQAPPVDRLSDPVRHDG